MESIAATGANQVVKMNTVKPMESITTLLSFQKILCLHNNVQGINQDLHRRDVNLAA